MAMANLPDLCFLRSVFVNTLTALSPLLTKHLVSKLAGCRNTLRVILIKYVHDFICDCECFILEYRVTRKSVNDLAERGKVPEKVPCRHIWHDEINRGELEVPVGLQDGVSVSTDP